MFRFLLRFFAVFIACSAFVGLASRPVFAYQVGTGNCPDPYSGNCGEIAPTDSSAPCDVNPLTFNTTHHENYGTYTLTAQYQAIDYTVSFDEGTGTGTMNSLTNQHVGDTITLPSNGFTAPSGYTFSGWSCDNDIGNKAANEQFTMPANDVTCTAQWTDTEWNIKYWGCVKGECGRCEAPLIPLTSFVDESKLTYGPNKLVTFPVPADEQFVGKIENQDYYFVGGWANMAGIYMGLNTKYLHNELELCTNLKPYYDLTYDCDWGDANIDPERYVLGKKVTVKDGSACGVRPGYDFTKWNCESEGKKDTFGVDAGGKFVIEADTKCTAQWEKKTYKVTYDCKGKTSKGNMVANVQYEDTYEFSEIDDRCSYEGYTFGGWSCYKTQTSDQTATYRCPADGDTCPNSVEWNFEDDLKCEALWYVNQYDVVYNKGTCANDESGTIIYTDPNGAKYGQKYSSSETAKGLMDSAIKTGYTFVGWNTESGQTESNWNGENPWYRQSGLTVYAACISNKYDVVYDKGTCESKTGENYIDKNGAEYGKPYYARSEGMDSGTGIYAGTGYVFKGWSETQEPDFNDDGTLENPWTGEMSWQYTELKTVYGICVPNTYSVIYKTGSCTAIDGTDGTFTDDVLYDNNYKVLGLDAEGMNIVTKAGYKFVGWKSNLALTTPDYDVGYVFEPWNKINVLTLWAVCEREPYHVEYDCDAGTSCNESDDGGCRTPKDETVYYMGASVAVPLNDANTCKKLGWTFDKWNCKAKNQESTQLPMIDAINRFEMINADALCVADWTEDHYSVTYDCNGGENPPTDSNGYTYGVNVKTENNTCERTGYEFVYWVCGEGDEAQEVPQEENFKGIKHDIVCQAQWTPKEYDIVYDSGTCAEKLENGEFYSVSELFEGALRFDGNYEIKDIADVHNLYVQRGYEFLGWSTENGGTTEADVNSDYSIGEHGPWTTDEDLTLYAVCKKKMYNICYNFQVPGAGWKSRSAKPLYTFDVDTEAENVLLANHEDNNEGNFYVFDGWYNTQGIYHTQDDTGIKIESIPSVHAEPLDEPMVVECDGTIASPQCEDEDYATCDVMLYAKWYDAGKVSFVCPDGFSETEEKQEGKSVKAKDYRLCSSTDGCELKKWYCDNYTGSIKDFNPGEYIEILIANTIVVCRPVKDCSNLEYNIDYHVYRNDEEKQNVINDGREVRVDDLEPSTYKPGDESMDYPSVLWPNCRFEGWYKNEDFTGEPVMQTPALAIDATGEDIVLYGKMVCENDFRCNEPGHDHWLHIGNNESDKVCLYENRPTNQTPAIRVQSANRDEPYYMMLSTEPDIVIHEGSSKRMRIQHSDGNIYNVCDKSSCPELAN